MGRGEGEGMDGEGEGGGEGQGEEGRDREEWRKREDSFLSHQVENKDLYILSRYLGVWMLLLFVSFIIPTQETLSEIKMKCYIQS